MKYTITVTQEDIDHGTEVVHIEKGDVCHTCPVALAARRIWPYAAVTYASILPGGRGRISHAIPLPGSVLKWIFAFEMKDEVKPFEFEVER